MGRLVGVVALSALLVVAWWLVRDAERPVAALEARTDSRAAGPATREATPEHDERDGLAAPTTSEEPSAQRDGAQRVPAAAHGEPTGIEDFRVRVLDADGTPLANVRVVLDPPDVPDGESAMEPVGETTDPRGRVRFPQARARIASRPGAWTLRHELPAVEAPSRVLDPSALERDEFDSVLPPGGRLEILVRELDGTPAPQGSELRLRLAEESAGEWRLALEGGQGRFPWVELGRAWELAAWRPQGMAPARARIDGPVLPGQTVRVELVLGADHAVVSFRAVDASGRPFASVPLDVARRQTFGHVSRARLETDANGRFLVDGERDVFDHGTFVLSHSPDGGGLLQGLATLPQSPQVGWNDGGDVVLEAQPLLCAGVVVDASGRAVAQADVVAGSDGGWLGSDAQVRGRSAADGRFELRGLWDSEEFDLRAVQDPMRSETIRARQGQDGIVLVLTPRFTISGSLRVDEGVDASAVRFQIQAGDGEPYDVERRSERFQWMMGAHLDFSRRTSTSDSADFELEPVPGGIYSLSCLLDGSELARTSPFALDADFHLGTIDLRGRIQVCEIILRGADDPGSLRGRASWNASGSAEKHEFDFEGERVRIQASTLPVDVVLIPRGHRLVRLQDVRGTTETDLEPTLSVRIVLATSGELPASPFAFGCELRQDGMSVGEPQGADSFEASSPEIAFRCSAVGKLEVHWHLERSFEGASFGGAVGGGVLDGHEVEIDVRDEAAEQVFTIELDGALLEELVRSPPW